MYRPLRWIGVCGAQMCALWVRVVWWILVPCGGFISCFRVENKYLDILWLIFGDKNRSLAIQECKGLPFTIWMWQMDRNQHFFAEITHCQYFFSGHEIALNDRLRLIIGHQNVNQYLLDNVEKVFLGKKD